MAERSEKWSDPRVTEDREGSARADDRADAALEERRTVSGRLPGDRMVRVVRPPEFRRGRGGIYVATPEAAASGGRTGRLYDRLRHVLFGRPLETEAEAEERLSKKTGL